MSEYLELTATFRMKLTKDADKAEVERLSYETSKLDTPQDILLSLASIVDYLAEGKITANIINVPEE